MANRPITTSEAISYLTNPDNALHEKVALLGTAFAGVAGAVASGGRRTLISSLYTLASMASAWAGALELETSSADETNRVITSAS